MPGWRNGRRCGLKIRCPKGRAGSTPALGTISFPTVFTSSIHLARLVISTPEVKMGLRWVTLSTSPSFEFDHIASRLGESVHCIFKRLGCAASVWAWKVPILPTPMTPTLTRPITPLPHTRCGIPLRKVDDDEVSSKTRRPWWCPPQCSRTL